MNILSLNCTAYGHDSAAAIVCDGELVAAVEEERLTRRKHDGSFPLRAVDYCLSVSGLEFHKIDVIAWPGRPFRSGPASALAHMDFSSVMQLQAEGGARVRSVAHKIALDAALSVRLAPNIGLDKRIGAGFLELRQRYGKLPPLKYYDHHHCHAAATFLSSGAEAAAVVTVDGGGDLIGTATWSATGNTLRRIHALPYTASLGQYYADATLYLGLGQFGEGKFMGLTAYGDPERYAPAVAKLLSSSGSHLPQYKRRSLDDWARLFSCPPRSVDESPLKQPYPDIAAAIQRRLEMSIHEIVVTAQQESGHKTVCMGGGVALNCSANGKLLSQLGASLWCFAAAGDAGLPLGAALLCAGEQGKFHRRKIESAYWGPGFSQAEIDAAVGKQRNLRFHRPANVCAEVAAELAAGKVIGWFQGRMELGPRALGNRSILADPRSVGTRDRVNRIKGREMWRPLSPSVVAERSAEYFDAAASSPFMLMAVQVRPEKRAAIPAVVHVDGSARPQTVTPSQNQRFHSLLVHFERLSGVPVLLNTSFNIAGEPIVCTPDDALRTFMNSDLDLLVLGDTIIERTSHPNAT
jgi:carbamoyltransferase